MANELNNQISSWELITIRLELLNQLQLVSDPLLVNQELVRQQEVEVVDLE